MPWHSQKLTWQWKSNHLKMYSVMSYIRSYYWLQYIPKCLCKTKMTTQNLRQVTLNIRLLFPVVRTFRVVAAPKIHSNTPWCTCHLALQAILPKFCPFRNSGHHKKLHAKRTITLLCCWSLERLVAKGGAVLVRFSQTTISAGALSLKHLV